MEIIGNVMKLDIQYLSEEFKKTICINNWLTNIDLRVIEGAVRGESVVGDAAPVRGPAKRHAPLAHAHEAGVDPH